MAVTKAHHEFHKIDLDVTKPGWELPEGYSPESGALELIISGSLDTANKQGSRTRILRFPPGFATFNPLVHDFWEEVFMFDGDMTVGADEHGNGGSAFQGHTYAVRPPGAWHGPFRSVNGCYLIETHYYDPA
jgi:hypothetical protein